MFTRLKEELLELAHEQRPYDDAAAAEYKRRLVESVRLRLQSEVPVGTSLSGGLDSSAVAVIINQLLNEGDELSTRAVGTRQNTFSAVFPGSINDEERYVDDVLEICTGHVDSHKILPTADEFKADLLDFIRTQEEPLISSGPYAQFQVMREATKHVTVLLDGQGADEMMAGYIPYYFVYLRQLRAQGATAAAGELAKSLDVLYRLGRFKLKAKLKLKKTDPGHPADEPRVRRGAHRGALRLRGREPQEAPRRGPLPQLAAEPAALRGQEHDAVLARGARAVPRQGGAEVHLQPVRRGDHQGRLEQAGAARRHPRPAARVDQPPPQQDRVHHPAGRVVHAAEEPLLQHLPQRVVRQPARTSNQTEVIAAFEGWIKGANDVDTMTFWRLINLELWMREFIDDHDADADAALAEKAAHVKTDYEPNAGRSLDLTTSLGEPVRRYPVRTELFSRDDDLDARVLEYVDRFFAGLPAAGPDHDAATRGPWWFFLSEKVVAITQGRSYFVWDIKVGRPARVLSRYVTRTPAGIGLGSPFTMQLAIQEAGLPRVLYASAGGADRQGAGPQGHVLRARRQRHQRHRRPDRVLAPTPRTSRRSWRPRTRMPSRRGFSAAIRQRVPEPWRSTFGGTVIMDANDIGRNVLGSDVPGDWARFEEMFADNPLGQGSEQTPMAMVFLRED